MENDSRIFMQTKQWQRRFKALNANSPDSEWQWLIANYNGDQDDLDHLFNQYKEDCLEIITNLCDECGATIDQTEAFKTPEGARLCEDCEYTYKHPISVPLK